MSPALACERAQCSGAGRSCPDSRRLAALSTFAKRPASLVPRAHRRNAGSQSRATNVACGSSFPMCCPRQQTPASHHRWSVNLYPNTRLRRPGSKAWQSFDSAEAQRQVSVSAVICRPNLKGCTQSGAGARASQPRSAVGRTAGARGIAVLTPSLNFPTPTPRSRLQIRLALVSGVGPRQLLIGTAIGSATTEEFVPVKIPDLKQRFESFDAAPDHHAFKF